MKVALVGAELEENLALRYIHASLVRAGHEPRIFDFHGPEQAPAVAAEVAAYAPQLVGLSMVFTARAREFLALAERLRASGYPGHVTCGGHFASFHARQILADCPALDSVIHGEGEEAIVDLLEHLDCPHRVTGLTWRAGGGRIESSGRRPNADDLDQRPLPTRPDVFHSYLGLPIANMLGSRGCFGNCRFCSINAWHRQNGGKRFRQRAPAQMAREMAHLYHHRGVRIFNFHDDNFFLPGREDNLRRLAELKRELDESGVGRIGVQVKARPDTVDADVFALLAEIGLFRVFLGVESNSVAGLKTLGRGIRREQNHEALALLERLDVHTCFNLLVFDPEATPADLWDNVAFIRRQARFPLNFCRVEVYAGTEIERRLRAEGRLLGGYLGYNYRLRDPQAQLAYEMFRQVFTPRNFRIDGMNHQAMKLDYYFHILKHFWPQRAGGSLRRKVKSLIADLNHDNAELLGEIVRFVQSHPGAHASADAAARRLARRRAEFDVRMGRQVENMLAAITMLAEGGASLRGRAFAKAASVAAAALVAAGVGCGQQHRPTHMTEMAPAPLKPGPPSPQLPQSPHEEPAPHSHMKESVPEGGSPLREPAADATSSGHLGGRPAAGAPVITRALLGAVAPFLSPQSTGPASHPGEGAPAPVAPPPVPPELVPPDTHPFEMVAFPPEDELQAPSMLSTESAAKVRARILSDYGPEIWRLAARHQVQGRAVPVYLVLDAAGRVAKVRVVMAAEDHPKFEEELVEAAAKWQFPGLPSAGACTAFLRPEQPALKVSAEVSVAESTRPLTAEQAARVQSLIEKKYLPELIRLGLKHEGPLPPVPVYLQLDKDGKVVGQRIGLTGQQAAELQKQMPALIAKWQFPGIDTAGACAVMLNISQVKPPDWHMFEMAPSWEPFDNPEAPERNKRP